MIALIAAFGGTAAADDAVDFAKSKLLNGSKIKKKSIAGNRLRNNTITGKQVSESKLGKVPSATKADSATNATNATNAGNANTLGGQAPTSYRSRWALVNADGTIAAQSGGISVLHGAGVGEYYVDFGSSQEGKPLSAVPKWTPAVTRVAQVALCGGGATGVTCVVGGTNDTNHVYVDLKNGSNTNVDTPFYVHIPPS